MDNYLILTIAAVVVVVLGLCVSYCQVMDEKHKEKVLHRAKKILSRDSAKRFEGKLETMLPLEVRQLSRMSDDDFRRKVTFLVC